MPDTKADGARLFADLPPRQICALHSGATVSYREAGPQAGEPVVLLYGIGGSSAGWVRQLVAPLAGHGRRLAAAAPRARLEIVERCGHLPHFEVPTDRKSVV